MDTYFGMGLAAEPLKRGYDCPLYATYVDALVNFGQSGPVTLLDAICIVSAPLLLGTSLALIFQIHAAASEVMIMLAGQGIPS